MHCADVARCTTRRLSPPTCVERSKINSNSGSKHLGYRVIWHVFPNHCRCHDKYLKTKTDRCTRQGPAGWGRPGKMGAGKEHVGSTAFGRTLARVLFAAGVRAALQADLLAVAGGDGVTVRWHGLWGADVGFDTDFFRHGELRLEKSWSCILSHAAGRGPVGCANDAIAPPAAAG